MVDAEAVRESLQEWLENPYWRQRYETAPTDKCKEYIALDYYYSDTEDDEVAEALDAMESELTLEDWKHLLRFTDPGPERGKILQMIQKLEQ